MVVPIYFKNVVQVIRYVDESFYVIVVRCRHKAAFPWCQSQVKAWVDHAEKVDLDISVLLFEEYPK